MHVECADAAIKAGALPRLVELLSSGNAEVVLQAARALASIGGSNAGRKAVLDEVGCLHQLVTLLDSGNADVKAQVAGTISALASEDEDPMDLDNLDFVRPPSTWSIITSGAVLGLVALLQQGDSEGKARAAEALFRLAAEESNRDPILTAEPLPSLVALFAGRADATTKGYAGGALRLLASNPDVRESIEAAVPRGQRGRESLLRTIQAYCF